MLFKMNTKVIKIIENKELLRRGHFVLASGIHSGVYWEKFRVLEQPKLLAVLCEPFAERFQNIGADIVVGPTLGGVLVAYEVARQMGITAVFAERASNIDGRFFRPPTILRQDHKVLIVDDVLMTGWTLNCVINAIHDVGAEICGIGVILNRSKELPRFTWPLFTVHTLRIPDYDPENCLLCKAGIPLTKAAGTT
jgi:orotate phosphoribosyltransferase